MMCTRLTVLFLVLAAAESGAQLTLPQDSLKFPIPQNILDVNVGGVAVDYTSLTFHTAVSRNDALGVSLGLVYRPVGGYLPRAITFGAVYRRYPGARALSRFHYTASLSWQTAWLTSHRDIASDGVVLGLGVGWQWFATQHFAVGFEVGGHYVAQFSPSSNAALRQVFGFRPLLSFALGAAW